MPSFFLFLALAIFVYIQSLSSEVTSNETYCFLVSKLKFDCSNLSKFEEILEKLSKDSIGLNISNNLISSLNIDEFQSLKYLNASFNVIKIFEFHTFYYNDHLLELDLSYNHIKHFISANLFNINSKLKVLFVKHNDISSIDITTLKNIQTINAAYNKLKRIHLSASNCKSLKNVFLEHNFIEILIFSMNCSFAKISIETINLEYNAIEDLTFLKNMDLEELQMLYIGYNKLKVLTNAYFRKMPNLKVLDLSGNKIHYLEDFTFSNLVHLNYLYLNNLSNLVVAKKDSFVGLHKLLKLSLNANEKLSEIHYSLFNDLTNLKELDLSGNNLSILNPDIFDNLPSLQKLNLLKNKWICNCFVMELNSKLKTLSSTRMLSLVDPKQLLCSSPRELHGYPFMAFRSHHKCEGKMIMVSQVFGFREGYNVSAKRHSNVIFSCGNYSMQGNISCIWTKTRGPLVETFFMENGSEKFSIEKNCSLSIKEVDTQDVGVYKCFILNDDETGNISIPIIGFRLNYEILSLTEIFSLVCGSIAAAAFLVSAILIGLLRMCCVACSKKEKTTETNVKEALITLTSSFNMERLSEYKTAQMEKFTAFRSSTVEQLSAFKNARVSKLRTYKQATVNGVLKCLDQMRVHYITQTNKIKENYQMQVLKLREGYAAQKLKFQGQKSSQVKRMKDSYDNRALKIKEYGSQQLAKLREQYKTQQQNLLKLLELLEIGTCVNAIEEDCSKDESVIFDPNSLSGPDEQDMPPFNDQNESNSFVSNENLDGAFEQLHNDVSNNMNNNNEDDSLDIGDFEDDIDSILSDNKLEENNLNLEMFVIPEEVFNEIYCSKAGKDLNKSDPNGVKSKMSNSSNTQIVTATIENLKM